MGEEKRFGEGKGVRWAGPGSGTPDPREARAPPDFTSHPQEAYDFVCSVLDETLAAKEKYKAKYVGSNAQNKTLRTIVNDKNVQIEALLLYSICLTEIYDTDEKS